MAYSQLAQLYLRGRMFNVILKNMPVTAREELDAVIEVIANDPQLQRCQIEFCKALSRTIKNEYADLNVGMQDYLIAIMRAVIIAMQNENYEQILADQNQRKKWFQTLIFNYLKQILRENKMPVKHKQANLDIECCLEEIIDGHLNPEILIIQNGFEIMTTQLPDIAKLRNKYLNVVITVLPDRIRILNGNKQMIQECPCEDNLEIEARERPMNNEIIEKLRERIPEDIHPILDIYIEDSRPTDYIEKYGLAAPKATHIASYLGISIKEVKRILAIIKIHLQVLQLGY